MEVHQHIITLIAACAEKYADKTFIQSVDGRRFTFRSTYEWILKSASFLEERGVRKGSVVSIALPNTPEFLILLFGALHRGATVVNLNPALSSDEWSFRLNDAGVEFLITSEEVFSKLSYESKIPTLTCICVLDSGDHLKDNTLFPFRLSILDEYPTHSAKPTLTAIAFLQYTGGTTGLTKAAMISHSNVLSSADLMAEYLSARLEQSKEVFVVTFPFYHVFSIVFQVLMAMQMGAMIVLYPLVRDFEALKRIILKKQFTVFVGVHTLYKMLLQDAEVSSQTFPQAKLFIAGAEHVQPITKERWKAATGHVIVEGYGLTETSALAAMSSLVESENDLDAIGITLPHTEITLINDEGRVITGIDQPGEICIRGPQVVEGYWNRAEENQLSFVNGWLRTGDIGIRKANGQYKIVDRKKDMIIVSGFNVYPNEVEAVLMAYPGINDCAAVAIPDEKSGERVVAFFVAAQDIDVMALQCFCRERLSAYKVPVKFLQADRIPKSPVGKTLRTELRASLLNNNVFNAV